MTNLITNFNFVEYEKKYKYLYAIFLVVSPFVLLFLAETFFDQGDTVCLSVRFFNLECYACGICTLIYLIRLASGNWTPGR